MQDFIAIVTSKGGIIVTTLVTFMVLERIFPVARWVGGLWRVLKNIGLAGFNGVELLDGLPRKLATMDACRLEIGRKAAKLIAEAPAGPQVEELFPTLEPGDTIRH